MRGPKRLLACAGIWLLLGCTGQQAAPGASPGPARTDRAAEKPSDASLKQRDRQPLLIVLIVDQLPAWVLSERLPLLPEDGGFARLAREGLYARELRYQHATTSTAPGHAALFTGLPPRGSGIYANERVDPVRRRAVSILSDPAARLVIDAPLEATSSSAAVLEAPTLGDVLRSQRPDAQIFSLSLKDRGAIIGGGRRPTSSVWFDASRGSFVTSSSFADELPSFVRAYNRELSAGWSRSWTLLDRPWVERHSATPDDQVGEGDVGLGAVFPHAYAKVGKPSTVFHTTPFADEALFTLGLAAIDASDARHPRLLTLSLSSFDYIGHIYGPDSWEAWDELRRLDRALASFLHGVEQRAGKDFSLLLTADHGSPPLPETAGNLRARPWCAQREKDYFERPCDAGLRLPRATLEKILRAAVEEALGPGDWIEAVIEPFVYYAPRAKALQGVHRDKLDAVVVSALEKTRGIALARVVRHVTAPCGQGDSIEALVCRSLTDRAGDVYVVMAPGSFFDATTAPLHGINHGSPYLYDRTVPLFVRSGRGSRAGEISSTPVTPADFVMIAAALLGIEPPLVVGR